jgi:hypothetical protein
LTIIDEAKHSLSAAKGTAHNGINVTMTFIASKTGLNTSFSLEHTLHSLSEHTYAQLGSLQSLKKEVTRLSAKLAVCQTAKMAYQYALSNAFQRKIH